MRSSLFDQELTSNRNAYLPFDFLKTTMAFVDQSATKVITELYWCLPRYLPREHHHSVAYRTTSVGTIWHLISNGGRKSRHFVRESAALLRKILASIHFASDHSEFPSVWLNLRHSRSAWPFAQPWEKPLEERSEVARVLPKWMFHKSHT